MSKIEDVKTLAAKLKAIADWQSDTVQQETATAKTLRDSSLWLDKLSRHMCGQGIVGCRGGEKCDSDHK